MSHILRSSDPKLHKREVTIHLHDTSFSPLHGLREDLCCGGSRRINPGLDSNTFVSGMTALLLCYNIYVTPIFELLLCYNICVTPYILLLFFLTFLRYTVIMPKPG